MRRPASRPSTASTPSWPARRGRLARREFEYVRNGTVSIIAALQVATGQVITEPITRNNSVTFISFLHRLDQCIAPHLNIHLVMDNGSSHTSAATRAWIAAHPRISVTCTPKHASWLDMAELWFGVLSRALLRRGEFTSRADLAAKITDFTIRYNRTARPWKWAYDARADHAAYLVRHHAPDRNRPALKPSRKPRNSNDRHRTEPVKDFCGAALGSPAADHAAAVITITVVLSVIAHGATADPLATRYARHLARQAGQRADAEIPGRPERRLIRRTASGG